MKAKKILLLPVLCAIALVSCNKNDVKAPVDQSGGEPFALNLKLGGAASRAVGNFTDVQPELTDGVIFFLNATGNVLGSADIDKVAAQNEMGQVFDDVNPNATEVYVVANIESSALAKSTLMNATTIADIKATAAAISSQQTSPAQTLLAPTYEKAEKDSKIKDVAGQDYKEARVALKPSVSRLQLADVTSSDDAIQSFKLAGVYVDNHFTQIYPTTEPGVNPSEVFTVGTEASELGGNPKMFDEYAAPIASTSNTVAAKDVDGTTGAVWNYQVPATNSDQSPAVPSLIVHLKDVEYTDASGGTSIINDAYVTVSGYKDAGKTIKNFEAGNVYNIPTGAFDFALSDLGPTPNAKDLNLKVFIEVLPWESVDIAPEF